jgi:nucleoside-diphosphate-sugar epimerase
MSAMDSGRKILIIGGSGFVSGTLARTAIAEGHEVWVVTRGQKPLPEGVHSLIADRNDEAAFAAVVGGAGVTWDLAVDCIAYEVAHAQQDVAVLPSVARHLVLISTDFVFDPPQRRFPQPFDNPYFLTDDSYGANKRRCEEALLAADTGDMLWTVFRPCHIYGPGSLLGCLPLHGRDPELLDTLRAGKPLQLIGGGHFLQQPIFVRDLAGLILSVLDSDLTDRKIYCSVGPDIVESREYYRIVADLLGMPLHVEELPVAETLAAHPEYFSFLCHRTYDLTPLRLDGLRVPNTPLWAGLREHVASLL